MDTFKTRISKTNSRVILANDYVTDDLETKTIQNIDQLHPFLCAIKLNYHLLLPLGTKQISNIARVAHRHGLQMIADIKLNDIGNTNRVATDLLWDMGFDAVIVNPIMGLESLKILTKSAHEKDKGVIALCHMSAPEAKMSYDMEAGAEKGQKLYQLFLNWALKSEVDGIVVGATFPEIIRYCSNLAKNRLDIYSPGVGTQGGDAAKAVSSGTGFLIVGRTILNAKSPIDVARDLHLQSLAK